MHMPGTMGLDDGSTSSSSSSSTSNTTPPTNPPEQPVETPTEQALAESTEKPQVMVTIKDPQAELVKKGVSKVQPKTVIKP
jgi:hypothetical protein